MKNKAVHLFKTILVGLCFLLCGESGAQEASWQWVHGDSSYNKMPVRKTFGTPHPENNPGSRYFATHWTDTAGNFWLYGGSVWYGTGKRYGDLWCYYPNINQWAWIWGDSTYNRVVSYGARGVTAAANDPGGRLWTAGCADNKGNLWLYAGWAIDSNNTYPQNDLWRYNIAENSWTWEAGTKTHAHYEPSKATQKHLPDTGFLPRPVWTGNVFTFDNDDHIYVFGGKSHNDTVNNHLFSYNTVTKEWTWLSGVLKGSDAGSYGTRRQFHIDNTPPARALLASGVYRDQYFLFGGGSVTNQVSQLYNDVWCYDRNSQQWRWEKGDNFPQGTGFHVGICTPDTLSNPDSRVIAVCANPHNIDSCGNLYIFGGNKTDHTILVNDVWVYNINTGIWTMLKPNKPMVNKAVFIEKNVPSADNNPGNVMGYASWVSKDGYLYVFGGLCHTPQTVVYNTMWKLVPDTTCMRHCYYRNIAVPPGVNDTSELFLPNAFTPNNDGRNDVIRLLAKNITLNMFVIYNRWGQEVFRTRDVNKGWDGTFLNTPQPVGTYFYYLKYTDHKGTDRSRSGDITLLR